VLSDKQAEDILLLDIRNVASFADYFVIASGGTTRQLQAILDAVDDALATGELFLVLLKRALARGLDTVGSLLVAAEAHQRKVLGSGFGGA